MPQYKYDVAISFAGENRSIARSLAEMLEKVGYEIFFDEFERAELWGEDLTVKLQDIYQKESRYCVVFVSQDYVSKPWTNHERRSALSRALKEQNAYVLPIKLDDSKLPGLPDTIAYLDYRSIDMKEILQILQDKLGEPSKGRPQGELILKAKTGIGLNITSGVISSSTGADVKSLIQLFISEDAEMAQLFGVDEARLKIYADHHETPDLSTYYQVEAPVKNLETVMKALRNNPLVEAAYLKPSLVSMPEPQTNLIDPFFADPPKSTPDFSLRQVYLDSAPTGIDAHHAWSFEGGRGEGVKLVWIGGAYCVTHEDLTNGPGRGMIDLQGYLGWRNYGSAIIGELIADHNDFGCSGICPEVDLQVISTYGGIKTARAIFVAASMLRPGDIILLTVHRPGPERFGRQFGLQGHIPTMWWPDDFDAIQFANSLGIIVIEAAGNGGMDLDDPRYNDRPKGFPPNWMNPFNPISSNPPSLLIGAGAPPPGTHYRDHGPDRSRLGFSNYGSQVVAQGWGREVTTCGYGDLQGGSSEELWYTDTFSGTESAATMVAGGLACVQGILRSAKQPPLTPKRVRELLHETGSQQQDHSDRPHTENIGNRPDFREILKEIGLN